MDLFYSFSPFESSQAAAAVVIVAKTLAAHKNKNNLAYAWSGSCVLAKQTNKSNDTTRPKQERPSTWLLLNGHVDVNE